MELYYPSTQEMYNPPPPGEVLLEAYMGEENIPDFAAKLGVTPFMLADDIQGRRRIDLHFAERLSNVLGTSTELWLNMQQGYDRWIERQSLNRDDAAPLRPAVS